MQKKNKKFDQKILHIICSVGICVYNEEKNIKRLLESLLKQKLVSIKIDEILIIASGSTDNTSEIVKQYIKKDKRIKLFKQPKREGKAAAVNLFIQKAKNEILVLCSGDLILSNSVIQRLTQDFSDPNVGMTGAHPIPLNNIKSSFSSFAGVFMWELHHKVSLMRPKMGELIAFRKVFKKIPIYTGADEANIEPLILGQEYKILYISNAKIFNKAPENIYDFIKQRRRNYWLHLAVRDRQHYLVSTLNTPLVLLAVVAFLKENHNIKYIFFIVLVMGLEVYCRLLGWWDYNVAKRQYHIWDPVQSTKKLSI